MKQIMKATLVALGIVALPVSAQQGAVVNVSGAVFQPGPLVWQHDARLRDAAVASRVRADAWFLGAALLRERALEPQQRLKAGILFDLRASAVHAAANNDHELRDALQQLHQRVETLPVTGRVQAQMNPLQQLLLPNNPLLEPRDHLVYPLRPNQVRVEGAVQAPCVLAYDNGWRPADYVKACPTLKQADPSWLYVIQPDGHVQKIGNAHWNAESVPVAVGAIIHVQFKPSRLAPDSTELNEELAAFLATQYQLMGILE